MIRLSHSSCLLSSKTQGKTLEHGYGHHGLVCFTIIGDHIARRLAYSINKHIVGIWTKLILNHTSSNVLIILVNCNVIHTSTHMPAHAHAHMALFYCKSTIFKDKTFCPLSIIEVGLFFIPNKKIKPLICNHNLIPCQSNIFLVKQLTLNHYFIPR